MDFRQQSKKLVCLPIVKFREESWPLRHYCVFHGCASDYTDETCQFGLFASANYFNNCSFNFQTNGCFTDYVEGMVENSHKLELFLDILVSMLQNSSFLHG
jgi:hypothetical protein